MDLKKQIEKLEREIAQWKSYDGEYSLNAKHDLSFILARSQILKEMDEKVEKLKERTKAMFWLSAKNKRKFIIEINELFSKED